MESNETNGEKARWKLQKNAASCFEQILEGSLHKTAVSGGGGGGVVHMS